MVKKILFLILFVVLIVGSSRAEVGYTVDRLILDIQTTTRGNLGLPDSLWMEIANMGIQNTASNADCTIDTVTIITTIGTFEYALPANFQKLWHAIDKSNQKVFDVIDAEDRGKSGIGVEVEEYKVYWFASAQNKTLGLYPTPAIIDTVFVYFYATPEIVDASADTVDIAEAFHPIVKTACLVELWERIERYDKANRDRALMINEINNIRSRLMRPPDVIVGPRTIEREH